MEPAVSHLCAATCALLTTRAGSLGLTPERIATIRPRADVPGATLPGATLPVLSLLPAMQGRANDETQAVVDALCAAAPHLPWRQTYSEEDGFDRRYLDSYGWFDLAGPTGPFQADGFRVMMGYWGQGLVYPDHAHPPDEHYFVLAGSAWFRLGDAPFEKLGPGRVFHTPPGAVHSADMRDEALLAMAVWQGEDVSVRINLTDSDRNVVAS